MEVKITVIETVNPITIQIHRFGEDSDSLTSVLEISLPSVEECIEPAVFICFSSVFSFFIFSSLLESDSFDFSTLSLVSFEESLTCLDAAVVVSLFSFFSARGLPQADHVLTYTVDGRTQDASRRQGVFRGLATSIWRGFSRGT